MRQADTARNIGLSLTTYRDLERGRITNPPIRIIYTPLGEAQPPRISPTKKVVRGDFCMEPQRVAIAGAPGTQRGHKVSAVGYLRGPHRADLQPL